MAQVWDIPDDDAFYESLPPLVPEGASEAERDRIIEEIARAWATPLPELDNQFGALAGVTLDRVALWDAEREEPIDLGELVRCTLELAEKTPTEGARSRRNISMRGCRIDLCDLSEVDFTRAKIWFTSYALRFGDRANFAGATFGEEAGFEGATFGDRAGFGGATFGNRAWFMGTTFGEKAWFMYATFGEGTSFEYATFGDEPWFGDATFGDRVGFGGATFGEEAGFGGATFGEDAWFGGATFGERAWFEGATFGEGAVFLGATFGEGAEFSDVDLVGATISDAVLDHADLRVHRGQGWFFDFLWPAYRVPFVLDHTRIRDADLHSRSRDPWSVLRRTYTGTGMVFILFFTLAAFLPLVGKTVLWSGMSKLQQQAAPVMLRSVEETHGLLAERPGGEWDDWTQSAGALLGDLEDQEDLEVGEVARVYQSYAGSREALRSFRDEHPSPAAELAKRLARVAGFEEQAEAAASVTAPGGGMDLRPRKVYQLALGFDRGWWVVGLAVVLILYNVARAIMTHQIGPMRDHADHVGRSPAWSDYRWHWYAHRYVLSWVLLISVAAFIARVAHVLWMPLLAPG